MSEAKVRQFAERLRHEGAAIWRAKVDAPDILGYFVEREEDDVVVDPGTLREPKQRAQLMDDPI